jgi:nucleoporin SEH1
MGGMTLASTGGDGMVKLWQANLNGVWHEQAVLDCNGSHDEAVEVSLALHHQDRSN